MEQFTITPAIAEGPQAVAAEPTLRDQAEAMKPRLRRDRFIWGIYLTLIVVSVIEVFCASSRQVTAGNILGPLLKHIALLGGGLVVMLILQRTHYMRFHRWAWVIVTFSVLAAIYTIFFGQNLNEAVRSFSFFGISVQPSELLKFSAALIIAKLLSEYHTTIDPKNAEDQMRDNKRIIIKVTCIVLFFSALMINQGLTNAILLVLIALSCMLIGGVAWKQFGIVLAIFAVLGLGYGTYKVVKSKLEETEKTEQVATTGKPVAKDRTKMRVGRILNFMRTDKYLDKIDNDNCQEQYSYIAQANGGMFGVGIGNSRETARIPLAFSDYIYAIIIEDTGFIGGMVVLALYLFLLARAGRIAMKCKKSFPTLLVIGMAVFITFQALMHMAIVTGAAPVSGQPLPLISKGGSSVIVTSVALGVMLSVSRFATRKGMRQEMRDSLTTLSDNEMSDNPTQL